MEKILIAEDDRKIAELERDYLGDQRICCPHH